MATSEIEQKIRDGVYSSIGNATAAVRRSKLRPGEKGRLIELIKSTMPDIAIGTNGHTPQSQPDADAPDITKVTNGSQGPTHFGRQNTIDGMAFLVMRYALEQEQSVEVVLDMIKHRITEA